MSGNPMRFGRRSNVQDWRERSDENPIAAVKFFAIGALILIPFTSAFAIDAWLPLNLFAVIVAVAIGSLAVTPARLFSVNGEDWFLLLTIIFGFVGLLYAPDYGRRTLNHSMAIITCVSLYYFGLRAYVFSVLTVSQIVNAIAFTTLMSAAFVIVEFMLDNFAGIQMRNIVPYLEIRMSDEVQFDSTMMGLWTRPRGFAIEAGHMATMFELGLPLSLVAYRSFSKVARILLIALSFAGFLLLASAAAITSLSIAGLVVASRRGSAGRLRLSLAALAALIMITVAVSPEARTYVNDLVIEKTFGFVGIAKHDNMSAFDRSQRARVAVDLATDFPLGFGWGTGAHLGFHGSNLLKDVPFGFISLYAEILVAGGWFALLSFVVFVALGVRRVSKIKTPESELLMVGVISLSIHYITISNYWFPALWAALALGSILERRIQTGTYKMYARNVRAL